MAREHFDTDLPVLPGLSATGKGHGGGLAVSVVLC
jgi:hypothetical protein